MADIQSATAEIRRGKKIERKKKPQGKNIMATKKGQVWSPLTTSGLEMEWAYSQRRR